MRPPDIGSCGRLELDRGYSRDAACVARLARVRPRHGAREEPHFLWNVVRVMLELARAWDIGRGTTLGAGSGRSDGAGEGTERWRVRWARCWRRHG